MVVLRQGRSWIESSNSFFPSVEDNKAQIQTPVSKMHNKWNFEVRPYKEIIRYSAVPIGISCLVIPDCLLWYVMTYSKL